MSEPSLVIYTLTPIIRAVPEMLRVRNTFVVPTIAAQCRALGHEAEIRTNTPAESPLLVNDTYTPCSWS